MSTPNLDRALLEAQRRLKPVAHDGENPRHAYGFVSVDQYVSTCRRALHAQGLVIKPVRSVIETGEAREVRSGEERITPTVTSDHAWILSHPESGEETIIHGGAVSETERGRPLSKAGAAARSAALRDMLRELLLVVRGDAADFEPEDEEAVPAQVAFQAKPDEVLAPTIDFSKEKTPAPEPVVDQAKVVAEFHAHLGGEGPNAADLKAAGWVIGAPSAEQLEALPATDPVFAQIRKDLHRECVKIVGKPEAKAAWATVGWHGPKGGEPTGLQCREMVRETLELYERIEASKHA